MKRKLQNWQNKITKKKAFKYAHSKMKVQDSVGYLRRPDGSDAQTNSEKVETLTAFFSAVFTREDTEELR